MAVEHSLVREAVAWLTERGVRVVTLDAVITQHQNATVLNCVRIFTNLRDALDSVEPLRINIVLRENLFRALDADRRITSMVATRADESMVICAFP